MPATEDRLQRAIAALRGEHDQRYAFAEISENLVPLGAFELERTVSRIDVAGLSAFAANYLAARVEYLCVKYGSAVPDWARSVAPLEAPWFASSLRSVRPHLLRASPVVFRRRKLFIDSGPDERLRRDA